MRWASRMCSSTVFRLSTLCTAVAENAKPVDLTRCSVRRCTAAAAAAASVFQSVAAKDSKPKTKKELEAERLALEEADKNKPPATGSGQFEFPNGAIYGQQTDGWSETAEMTAAAASVHSTLRMFECPAQRTAIHRRHTSDVETRAFRLRAGALVTGHWLAAGRADRAHDSAGH